MKRFLSIAACFLAALNANAQDYKHVYPVPSTDPGGQGLVYRPIQHFYVGTNFAGIFSSTLVQRSDEAQKMTTLRYTMGVNVDVTLNYDCRHFGVFLAPGIKNIGFIEQMGDSTVKRRVYTIGSPIGFKIGNLAANNYVMFGAGVDYAFNYREKGFVRRGDKQKFNEFFSDRTEPILPYGFLGFACGSKTLKFTYYPSNFLNQNFTDGAGAKPYAAYNKTQLMMVSLGVDLHFRKLPKEQPAKQQMILSPAVQTM